MLKQLLFLANLALAIVSYGAGKPTLFMIPQTHSPVQHGGQITTDVVESQMKIFNYFAIWNSNTVIFNEDTFEDSKSPTPPQSAELMRKISDAKDKDIEPWMKEYFKLCFKLSKRKPGEKLPTLSEEEKELIARVGAINTLNFSGYIARLRSVADSEEQGDQIMERVETLLKEYAKTGKKMQPSDNDPLYKLMNTEREKLALKHVQSFFKSAPKATTAYIVFGRGHDFRRHQAAFQDFDIKIDPNFSSDSNFWEDISGDGEHAEK